MTTHAKTIILVAGVCVGIIVGELSNFASEIAIASILLAITQVVLMLAYRRWLIADSKSVASVFTILFCIGIFVGIIREQFVEQKNIFTCESICTFNAKIISSPEVKDDYQIFKVSAIDSSESLYVQVRTPLYPKYKIGEMLKLSGKVTVPKIIPPHIDKKSPAGAGGFDYSSYLLTQNVGSEIFYPRIEIIDDEAHTITEYLGRWKEDLINKINTNVSTPASSLANGMLFGSSPSSRELTQTFRTAGLSHIIVLSGFNIAIVIAGVLFVLTFLPLMLRITVASISVVLFVMMVGAEASVLRATIMAFITLLAIVLGRQYVAHQALILSFFAIIMYEPYSLLHDVSLHLSFLATAGIVYLSQPFNIVFENIKNKNLKELLITTSSAYFATLPYIMYTFGTVSSYALIANILVLPFVPVAMLISFLVVLFSYVSNVLSVVFGFIDSVLINIMIWIAQSIEYLPFSTFPLTISLKVMLLVYIFIMIGAMYLLWKRKNETKITTEGNIITGLIRY